MTLSERFLKTFERNNYPINSQTMSPEEIAALPSALPSSLIELFKEYGRCQTFKGALNICHPDDLKGVVTLVFGGDKDFSSKTCHAFAYSAFGQISLWIENLGICTISIYNGEVFARSVTKDLEPGGQPELTIYVPFYNIGGNQHEYYDINGDGLFKRAVKKCGPLEIGECYGFFPALAMGGLPDIEFIKRTDAAAHFAFVAQTMDYQLVDIQGYGKSVVVRPIG